MLNFLVTFSLFRIQPWLLFLTFSDLTTQLLFSFQKKLNWAKCVGIFALEITKMISKAIYCYRLFFFLSSDFSTRGWTCIAGGWEGMEGEGSGRSKADLALRTRTVSTFVNLRGRLWWWWWWWWLSSLVGDCSPVSLPLISRAWFVGLCDTWV